MKVFCPKSIFVLRNNDLGDVLVATPLLHGLRRAFPSAKICMGVGDWAKSLLGNNPDLDQVLPCNAPWHNKQNCRFPANSVKTFAEGLLYLLLSRDEFLAWALLLRRNPAKEGRLVPLLQRSGFL